MTRDQILRALGLQDPLEWEKAHPEKTGSSTRTIVRALHTLLRGEGVVLIAPEEDLEHARELTSALRANFPVWTPLWVFGGLLPGQEPPRTTDTIILDHRWNPGVDNRLLGLYGEIVRVDQDGNAYDLDGDKLVTLTPEGIRNLSRYDPYIFPAQLRDAFQQMTPKLPSQLPYHNPCGIVDMDKLLNDVNAIGIKPHPRNPGDTLPLDIEDIIKRIG